jgi:sterol desaturase/sphingolipid hydroxylase (fatty acid hydroxylase superfamily)
VQALVLALDLVDRHLTRKRRYGGEPLRVLTALFLGLVLLIYFAVQYAGFALVPGGADLVSALGQSSEPPTGSRLWALLMIVPVFYLSGLWDYLLHRFVSHSRWLWFTHEYHHLPSQVFVAMPGLAARPFAVVATFPVSVATVAVTEAMRVGLGLPGGDLESLKILLLIQVGLLTTSHSCCLRRWWWIHRILRTLALTTPHEHVLHHAVRLEGNYGNFTTLWDRVFGTYLDPTLAKHREPALGLAYDQDFLGALTARMIRLPESVRARFQVERYCNLESVPRAR